MSAKKPSPFTCPTCKAKSERGSKTFPFCSERCQLIDLGNWADGSYSIADESTPFEDQSPSDNTDPTLH